MTRLEQLIPHPRRLEIDHVDLAATPAQVWDLVRHGDLGQSPWTSALFALRTIPDRLVGRKVERAALRIDQLVSTVARPGFQVLGEDPPREIAVGAIGKVWRLAIPFVHVPDAAAYAAFAKPGFIKVAWALRVEPRGEWATRLSVELRVDATDDASWTKFVRYFRLIGPFSHFIRKTLLSTFAARLGTPDELVNVRPLPGDELLPDAEAQVTHSLDIAATPSAIWPWLVQMGCRRAGFYSIDVLDNGGAPSAREIHPELQLIEVGQILPATPTSNTGFEVLAIERERALILGGLFDPDLETQLPFASVRPSHYWHVTWAFSLEPLDADTTRLYARTRAAYPPNGRVHATLIRPVHELMQRQQLRHLAARAEGRLHRDHWRDVVDGVRGATRMAFDFVTPFARRWRNRWGITRRAADRMYPGDALVAKPRWGWTHAIEIDTPAESVWPWVAQIGADRGGFYSYQWLENLAGCQVKNAETIHPEWQLHQGDGLVLHPAMPPLNVVELVDGKYFVAFAEPARTNGKPWVAASWLFMVEPLGPEKCRFISRYRVDTSADLRTRASFGPALIEPIGFEMDRKMLLSVKERAERQPS